MPDEPIDRILDAAYACFIRHGVRRTTMDDIAAAAEMSRPAVYQYVRNKDDAFRRLATRLFDTAVTAARAAAAETGGPLADRLFRIISAKLELTVKLVKDTPHAAELLDAGTRLSGDLTEKFTATIRQLISDAITDAHIDLVRTDPDEIAEIMLALIYGLEQKDLDDPDRMRRQLRVGVELLLIGASAR